MSPLAVAVTREPLASVVSLKKMVMRQEKMPRCIAFWTTERANLLYKEFLFHWRMKSHTSLPKIIEDIMCTLFLINHFQVCNRANRENVNKLSKFRMHKTITILWTSNLPHQKACIWRALIICKYRQFCLQVAHAVPSYQWYVNLF